MCPFVREANFWGVSFCPRGELFILKSWLIRDLMVALENGGNHSPVLTQPIRKELIMSNRNSTFNDLQTTAQNLENLLTALSGLGQYHQVPDDMFSLFEKLESEVSDLQLSLGLITHRTDFAFEMGLLRGLPLDAKHKQPEDFIEAH